MSLKEIDFTAGVQATTYGLGPFHPAIRNGKTVWYWPNITMENEDDAYRHALISLSDACEGFLNVFQQWNIYKID